MASRLRFAPTLIALLALVTAGPALAEDSPERVTLRGAEGDRRLRAQRLRRRPARPADGAAVEARRSDQGDPAPPPPPAAPRAGAGRAADRSAARGAGTGAAAGHRSADPQLRGPGLHRRQPARHRGRRRPPALHPVDQRGGGAVFTVYNKSDGTRGRRPDRHGIAGHRQLRQRPRRPGRALRPARRPLVLERVQQQRQPALRLHLADQRPDHRRLVRLPVHRARLPGLPEVRRLAGRLLRLDQRELVRRPTPSTARRCWSAASPRPSASPPPTSRPSASRP